MFSIAIITASDKGSKGERIDQSGKVIATMMAELGRIDHYAVLPDDEVLLQQEMMRLADEKKVDLILTTGGTGLGPRDVTPEATLSIIDRQVPGIPETMRAKSLEVTARAMLTRSVAGLRKKTLIINLPGSPKGVKECLDVVLPVLEHALQIMKGMTAECARQVSN